MRLELIVLRVETGCFIQLSYRPLTVATPGIEPEYPPYESGVLAFTPGRRLVMTDRLELSTCIVSEYCSTY